MTILTSILPQPHGKVSGTDTQDSIIKLKPGCQDARGRRVMFTLRYIADMSKKKAYCSTRSFQGRSQACLEYMCLVHLYPGCVP